MKKKAIWTAKWIGNIIMEESTPNLPNDVFRLTLWSCSPIDPGWSPETTKGIILFTVSLSTVVIKPKASITTAVQKLITSLEGWNFFVGDACNKMVDYISKFRKTITKKLKNNKRYYQKAH